MTQKLSKYPRLDDFEKNPKEAIQAIISSPANLSNRCCEIGDHFRSLLRCLYEEDVKTASIYLKKLDDIPDIKNLSVLADSKFFENKSDELSFLSNVSYSLNCMSEEEREIVWECYFYPANKKKAMVLKSKSAFYRMKYSGGRKLVEMVNTCFMKLKLDL